MAAADDGSGMVAVGDAPAGATVAGDVFPPALVAFPELALDPQAAATTATNASVAPSEWRDHLDRVGRLGLRFSLMVRTSSFVLDRGTAGSVSGTVANVP